MYGFNANDFPDRNSISVCAQCFGEGNIRQMIEDIDEPPGCSFCECNDSPTAPIYKVCDHIRECLQEFFAFAADHLPYESKAGGYLWPHWSTYELLYHIIELDLPRDQDVRLSWMIADEVSDQIWCEYDWLSLDYDELLRIWWEEFCQTIQHERRFFFAIPKENIKEDEHWIRNREEFDSLKLLTEIVNLANELELVQTVPAGTRFYRSRKCKPDEPFNTARKLGPPPRHRAFKANRMNPPGIPMMYGSETAATAVLESRSTCDSTCVSVGQFEFMREVRILNLAELPEIPSIFSGIGRRRLMGLVFMHGFAKEIARPVSHDDESFNFEYIPSQVVTEYIRDAEFDWGQVDGIRYSSELHVGGRNLVLFATPDYLIEPDGTPVSNQNDLKVAPWIRLVDSRLDNSL